MISVIIIELLRQEVGSDNVELSLLNFNVKKFNKENTTPSNPTNYMISVIITELLRQEVGSDNVELSLLNFLCQEVGSDGYQS